MPEMLLLTSDDEAVFAEIGAAKSLTNYLSKTEQGFVLRLTDRGTVKRELIRLGWPVKDEAPFVPGQPLELTLRETAFQDGTLPCAIISKKPRVRCLELLKWGSICRVPDTALW